MTEPICRLEQRLQLMGGAATLVLDVSASDRSDAERALQAAVVRLQQLESRYSRYRSDSLVSLINGRAGSGVVTPLDEEAYTLFRLGARLWEMSQGLFDVTSGILRRAWDFRRGGGANAQKLAALLPAVGWDKVELGDRGIHLPLPGMEVDLGGLVKEYAADTAIALLRGRGVQHALVELAGDVTTLGVQGAGAPWRVGITDPGNRQHSLRTLELSDAAVATSGNYARRLDYQGRQLGHLLDPKTGWPVAGPGSVSVLSDSCVTAGAVATVACLKPVEAAESWLQSAGLPWLMVDDAGRCRGPLA